MSDFWNNVGVKLNQNLPAILTGTSIVTGIATSILAVYEGMKLNEELTALPDDATNVDKAKVIARRTIPVAVGAAISVGTCYAAHHESTKRYVALAGTLAIANAEKKDLLNFKEKAEEVLGKEKSEEIEKEVKEEKRERTTAMMAGMSPNRTITIHDLETGYVFDTCLRDWYDAIETFNRDLDCSQKLVEDFFIELLDKGHGVYDLPKCYGDWIVGYDTTSPSFIPELGIECGPNMEPIYTIEYGRCTDNPCEPGRPIQTVGGFAIK